ncbi:hypothetical protein ABC795_09435 [Blastococcus sp. HT6-30]|uniref:hypothetical protein n=1 Tax=Blastococcus sp. HT6-30 TaxID=3144843 RepID=UPI00321BC7A1
MTTRPTSSRGVEAAVTGAVTGLYYATPDFIPSRRARGWAKAGLVAASVAAAIPGARAARATAREAREEGSATSLPQAFRALTTGRRSSPSRYWPPC